jgi:hypothetical protein
LTSSLQRGACAGSAKADADPRRRGTTFFYIEKREKERESKSAPRVRPVATRSPGDHDPVGGPVMTGLLEWEREDERELIKFI